MITLQIEIFLLLFLGYLLSRLKLISPSTRSQLTNIVLDLILPAAIIKSFEIDITWQQFQGAVLVFFASVVIQIIYVIFYKVLWRNQPEKRRINLNYATLVSNAGFMGMPVAQAVFGDLGLMYASIFLIPQRVMMWSAGLSMYCASDWKTVIKKVCTHPCIIALAIGVVVLFFRNEGIYLPDFIDSTLAAVANCNTALCMFVIGAILAEADKKDTFSAITLEYSCVRLIILPLVILALCRLVQLDTLSANVCILESAMPAASTTAMLAAKYDKDPEFASKLIFVSTLLSLVTLPVMTWLIHII